MSTFRCPVPACTFAATDSAHLIPHLIERVNAGDPAHHAYHQYMFDPVLRAAGSRAGELDGHGVLGITGDHAMGTCTGCQTTFRFHHGHWCP